MSERLAIGERVVRVSGTPGEGTIRRIIPAHEDKYPVRWVEARAMNDFERAMTPRCDWCGYRTDSLSVKPTIDGSRGDGDGTHRLCRRCVGRYNQEAREYRAKQGK